MAALHLVCSSCASINRVPSERLHDNPSCGKCKRPVLDGSPVSLNNQTFDRFITKNDLPVVVDFWADWCGPCKMMAPVFSQVASELATQVRFAKVDTEQARELAARYAIRSIPTLIKFKQGKESDRLAGAMDLGSLKRWSST
jgi:thioredoxin 2